METLTSRKNIALSIEEQDRLSSYHTLLIKTASPEGLANAIVKTAPGSIDLGFSARRSIVGGDDTPCYITNITVEDTEGSLDIVPLEWVVYFPAKEPYTIIPGTAPPHPVPAEGEAYLRIPEKDYSRMMLWLEVEVTRSNLNKKEQHTHDSKTLP